jgi:hypothetical protein
MAQRGSGLTGRGSGRHATEPLRCPACGSSGGESERFCPSCGLPLAPAPGSAVRPTERQRRARRIKPQLAEGRLVRVTTASSQPEAEMLAELLLEAGVPALVRRPPGFDVPELLAAGPRELLVPASGVAIAREALALDCASEEADRAGRPARVPPAAGGGRCYAAPAPARLAIALLVALALGTLLIWAITQLR